MIDALKEWQKCTVLCLNEMRIKENLVLYEKHSGSLIRFTNLGDANNRLLSFRWEVDHMNLDGMHALGQVDDGIHGARAFYQPAIPICSVPIIMCNYFRGVAVRSLLENSLLPREMWLQSIFKFIRIHN